MKLRMDVKEPTPYEWLEKVLANFNDFLIDHADNERKASAMGMSFIAKYPNRTEIIPRLIDHALEELEHFRGVYKIMHERNIHFPTKIGEDLYAQELVKLARSGWDDRFLDRLLIGSVIEVRGEEKFRMVEKALEEGELKAFYRELWISEAKHGDLFVELALNYFPEKEVFGRLEFFNLHESQIMMKLPFRAAMH
ncbi:MAG: tRNA-(ms[2]io[6]A)-hydroxylase [Deltaproteobacteria bacterium]